MYQRYAEHRGWRMEVLDLRESELGGVDGVTFLVKGKKPGSACTKRPALTGCNGSRSPSPKGASTPLRRR